MQNAWLNSVKDWLSYDIVTFKIELGVEEKFICKNVTKQQTLQLHLCRRHVSAAVHRHGRSRSSMQLGHDLDFTVNFLGLCDPSNLLCFLSAEERRAFLK